MILFRMEGEFMKDNEKKAKKSNSSSNKSKIKNKHNVEELKKFDFDLKENKSVNKSKANKEINEKDNVKNKKSNQRKVKKVDKKVSLKEVFMSKANLRTKKGDSEAVKLYKKKKVKKKKRKAKFNGKFNLDILDLLIIVVVVAIVSCVLTGIILNNQFKKGMHMINNDLIADKNVQDFLSTYSEIVDNYYEEVDSELMMKAAMEGMVDFLEDNYSIYLNQDDSSSLTEMLDGSYEGLGIVVTGNLVNDVYKNSPAEKVGIKAGDVIVEINNVSINSQNYVDFSSLIDMENENSLTVLRNGEKISFKIKASIVDVPTTTSNIIKSPNKKWNIGYISLNAFSSKAFEEFQNSLLDLESKGIDSLIIDLRGNTGGYLNAATNISSLFLEKGEVIYSLENKNKITTYKDETNDKRDYAVVILVNNSTASAAEILTAALHDSYGATIVGKKTYGKGKVQTMKYYEDTIVKYTSAKWLRPNGECIDEIGIEPDFDIDNKLEGTTLYDMQLDKAIEILGK